VDQGALGRNYSAAGWPRPVGPRALRPVRGPVRDCGPSYTPYSTRWGADGGYPSRRPLRAAFSHSGRMPNGCQCVLWSSWVYYSTSSGPIARSHDRTLRTPRNMRQVLRISSILSVPDGITKEPYNIYNITQSIYNLKAPYCRPHQTMDPYQVVVLLSIPLGVQSIDTVCGAMRQVLPGALGSLYNSVMSHTYREARCYNMNLLKCYYCGTEFVPSENQKSTVVTIEGVTTVADCGECPVE
jgi:hypothetical protein